MNRFLSDSCFGKEEAARLRDAALLAVLDNASDMMFIKNLDGVYAAASMPFVKMVGKETLDEVIGRTDFDIFEDQELAKRYVMDDRRLLDGGKNLVDYIEPLPDEDGRARYGSTSKYILSDEDGRMMGLLGITRDITRDYLTRQYYQNELSVLFDLPADTYAAALVDIEDWRLVSERRQSVGDVTLAQCGTVESLKEQARRSVVGSGSEAAVFYDNLNPAFLRDIYEGGTTQLSFKYLRHMPDASLRWTQEDVRFMIDPETGHQCVILIARDIDAEKREELNLVTSAKMDRMTMLLNRETVMKEIEQTLQAEPGSRHALLMLDVDNFKNLNDTQGHQAGDKFLVSLANELRSFFGEKNITGRLGGDEFLILMKNIPCLAIVESRLQALLAVTRAVCMGYSGIGLSVSIGVSQYPKDGTTLNELYAKADKALYQAKNRGKDQVAFA